jgi:hypothetical protein
MDKERIGLNILLDEKHKDWNLYYTTLISMLDKYSICVELGKGFIVVFPKMALITIVVGLHFIYDFEDTKSVFDEQ